MILKFLLVFSFSLIHVITLDSQSNPTKRLKKQFIETEHFGISKQPITNREYLLFLCWNIHVYGMYNSIDLLPEAKDVKKNINFKLEDYISNSSTVVRNYTFNPSYLDYPALGLNYDQVQEMLKWLSDRYNENVLLRLGYLNFTPDQKDSDCFVLESYLTNQYTGSVRNYKVLHWNDNKFLPVFRLPTQGEHEFMFLNSKEERVIKKYKYRRNSFLAFWNNYYFEKSGTTLILNLNRYHNIELKANNSFDFSTISEVKVVFSSSVKSGYRNLAYFKDTEYIEKDIDGKMPFVILGKNTSNDAIIGLPHRESDLQNLRTPVYRIAYNTVLEFKYWP